MKRPCLCFVGWADHVHLERWATYFAKQGYRVSVISFSGEGHYPGEVRQYRLGLDGRGPRWVILKLRYLFWRIRPDIVHVHWTHFAPQVRQAWPGPLVVTAWGSDVYLRERFSDDQWTATADALRAADLITCDSNDLASVLGGILGVSNPPVEVIQWGVDTELFSPHGPDKRDEYGLTGRAVVFSVRNFTPLYNQETVVAAFARVRKVLPDAFLLMKNYGGEPAYVDRIQAQIRMLGLEDCCRIVETVPYDDMPALYRTADAVISIPMSDATPMSLLEAMSVGSIPVVSDLPSLREWVRTGETGYLVPACDVEAVATALLGALAPARCTESMRLAARQMVEARASQAAFMGMMARRYDGVARKNGGGGVHEHRSPLRKPTLELHAMTALAEKLLNKYYGGTPHPYRIFENRVAELVGPDTVLLDAGCGRTAPVLSKFLGRVARPIGIEVVDFVDVPEGIETHTADLATIPLSASTVDVVMSRSVFEHLVRPEAVYAELFRVLRPGGTVVFLTANMWDYATLIARVVPNTFHAGIVRRVEGRAEEDTFPTAYKTNTRKDVERLARASGFIVESFEYLNQYPNYLMFNGALFFLGTCYERLTSRIELLRFLRGWILVTLRKPAR